jgi:hypothetical protein
MAVSVRQHMLPARHMPPVSSPVVGCMRFHLRHELVLGFRDNRLLASLTGNGQGHGGTSRSTLIPLYPVGVYDWEYGCHEHDR